MLNNIIILPTPEILSNWKRKFYLEFNILHIVELLTYTCKGFMCAYIEDFPCIILMCKKEL